MQKKAKLLGVGLIAVLAMGVSACTGTGPVEDNPTAVAGDPFGRYDKTVEFTIGGVTVSQVPAGETYEDNKYTQYILDRVNVQPRYLWNVDPNTYDQKIALTIASGDLPDAFLVNDRQTLEQLVDSGLVADLTDVVKGNLSPMLQEMYDSFGDRLMGEATFDGRLMALPGTNIGGGENLMWIRQDWLDKLGLPAPTTLDEVVATAEAFRDQDPGGNGPGKTIGITGRQEVAGLYNSMHGLDTIFSSYGSYPRQWIKGSDGKIVYGTVAPETKDALTKLHEMYEAGVIDPQFALRKASDSSALLAAGQAGIMFGAWWAPYDALRDSVVNNPKADWRPYLAPLDKSGDLNVYSQNPVNRYLVIRKGYEHPEAIIRALNAENEIYRAGTPEAVELLAKVAANGEQPMGPINLQIDYQDVVDRFYKQLKSALDQSDSSDLPADIESAYDAVQTNDASPGTQIDAWSTATARLDGQALVFDDRVKVHDSLFFGTTKSMKLKWANLQKLEDTAMLKFIMGERDLSEFDDFVQEWKSQGGEQVTEEVEQEVG